MTNNQVAVYNAEVISPSTNKGGVLKTTITINIGGGLSLRQNKHQPWRKNKVLLVDKDGQGNVLLSFGKNPDNCENTIYDVLLKEVAPEDAIIEITDNLHVLPANDDMAFFDLDVLTNIDNKDVLSGYSSLIGMLKNILALILSIKNVSKGDKQAESDIEKLEIEANRYLTIIQSKVTESGVNVDDIYSLLKKAIAPLKDKYDYIIIDTPPQLGLIAGNVYNAADDILIPFHPEKYSFRSMIKSINTINEWKESNPNLSIKGIIPVKVKKSTLTHNIFLDSSSQIISTSNSNPIYITETRIPESIKPAESIVKFNLPITMIDEDEIKNKKEREPIMEMKKVYNNLIDELGY
ncbi:AAA family ATPase [Vagococcus sp. BWB3-3]|uniref:AAA family ATPase n=1 Tax=Vagococcus allomyrinae TaxID=2794353 RepID=A0A940PGS8_9ENTE|nr:ParA family protein [Vagococcus allomyrinae]MBP1044574.1 AAA family ATPase [Vagococcus allomyrinae]